eukprot:m.78586 g.78586  ORF g.78586 m.78586 type:complete len:383 (+) comp25130_c0_seq1:170-1318(+)
MATDHDQIHIPLPRRNVAWPKRKATWVNFGVHSLMCSLMLVLLSLYNTKFRQAALDLDLLYVAGWLFILFLAMLSFHRASRGDPGFVDTFSDNTPCNAALEENPDRWCRLCQQSKPIRAKHCFACKRCVRRFDHHCPYLGQCVGERNAGAFTITMVLHTTITMFSLVSLWAAFQTTPYGMVANLPLATAIFVCVCGVVIATVLSAIHIYLALTGTTTHELFKGTRIFYLRNVRGNPFDLGSFTNLRVLFTSDYPYDWDKLHTAAAGGGGLASKPVNHLHSPSKSKSHHALSHVQSPSHSKSVSRSTSYSHSLSQLQSQSQMLTLSSPPLPLLKGPLSQPPAGGGVFPSMATPSSRSADVGQGDALVDFTATDLKNSDREKLI